MTKKWLVCFLQYKAQNRTPSTLLLHPWPEALQEEGLYCRHCWWPGPFFSALLCRCYPSSQALLQTHACQISHRPICGLWRARKLVGENCYGVPLSWAGSAKVRRGEQPSCVRQATRLCLPSVSQSVELGTLWGSNFQFLTGVDSL